MIPNGLFLTLSVPRPVISSANDASKDALGENYAQPVAARARSTLSARKESDDDSFESAEWEQFSTGDVEEQVIATPAMPGTGSIPYRSTLCCFGLKDQRDPAN